MEKSILIPTGRLQIPDLERFRNAPFEKMIKFALGGEMHSDAEAELLSGGSNQSDIWGGNLWPWEHPPRIEYISLINIRPSVENRGMDILIDHVRNAAQEIIHEWLDLQ